MRFCSKIVCLLGAISLAVSCSKSNQQPENVNLGYQYFPLADGYWIRYSVTEITIDAPIARYDTLRYELKEVFRPSDFDSTADGTHWYIEQWRRSDSSKIWQKVSAASLLKNVRMLLRTDNNIPVVKQCYPFTKKTSWNGNAYNRLEDQDYTIVSVAQKETIGAFAYDSVTTVEHYATESLYEKEYEDEKYASCVGMVQRTTINVESQSSTGIEIDLSKPIMTRITKGTITTIRCLQWKH